MGQVKRNTAHIKKNKRTIPEQEWHEREDFMIWAFDVSVLYNLSSSVGVSVIFLLHNYW